MSKAFFSYLSRYENFLTTLKEFIEIVILPSEVKEDLTKMVHEFGFNQELYRKFNDIWVKMAILDE